MSNQSEEEMTEWKRLVQTACFGRPDVVGGHAWAGEALLELPRQAYRSSIRASSSSSVPTGLL